MPNADKRIESGEVVSIKEHLERVIADLQRHVDCKFEEVEKRNVQRFEGQERAVRDAAEVADKTALKVDQSTDKRMEAIEEIKGLIKEHDREIISLKETRSMLAGGSATKGIGWTRGLELLGAAIAAGGLVYALTHGAK